MKDNIKTMNADNQRDDFKTQWQRRQQWQEQAQKSVPDDETFLRWTERAQQNPAGLEMNVITFPNHRRIRWIPYAAAACIAVGVAAISLNRHDETDNSLPETKEVTVGGQTIHFLCNNGCSAQDIILSAKEVIK